MHTDTPLPIQFAVLAVLLGGLFLLIRAYPPLPDAPDMATSTQVSATAASMATTSTATSSARAISPEPKETATVKKQADAAEQTPISSPPNPNQIHRIEDPYPTAPFAFETVNDITRSALVNIFCAARNGPLRPISGSGVIIDPRGVVLTNAHVAQYVLLAESGQVNLRCQLRTGSPATSKWAAHVLYVPSIWVDEHAADLTKDRPFGTGKHDFALLYVGDPLDGSPRQALFPYIAPDTREAIGFVDDAVLAASYPAEFLGSITANFNLYQVTSVTQIGELYTLGGHTADVMSIGSVIGAQSGSSGGAIVNAWARLLGLITTTSDGSTTGERKLRGITLSYINRDMLAQTGASLAVFLSGDIVLKTSEFQRNSAPALVAQLLNELQ